MVGYHEKLLIFTRGDNKITCLPNVQATQGLFFKIKLTLTDA